MGKQWKHWQTFIFLASKITADGDYSHEIKRLLLLGRKAITNLDSILKSRDITLPTKVCLVKAMVFPLVMWNQPVHSKGDQSWVFFGRTDAEAETPILWPPYAKSWSIGKDSDAGRDWRQEEKGMTEDEMAGWHHWLNGRESEWTPRPGVLQFMGSQRVGHDCATELNWTEYSIVYIYHNFFIHSSLMDI